MNWLERLNYSIGAAPILHWNYSAHLTDNVPHRHTFFEVCLVGGYGRGIFSTEDQKHEIAPDDVFFARPGVIHQIQNTQKPLMELFWVSFQMPAQSGEIGALWDAFSQSSLAVAHDSGAISALWMALRKIAEAPETVGKDAQIAALSSALLLAIAQLGAGSPAAPSPIFEPQKSLAQVGSRACIISHEFSRVAMARRRANSAKIPIILAEKSKTLAIWSKAPSAAKLHPLLWRKILC